VDPDALDVVAGARHRRAGHRLPGRMVMSPRGPHTARCVIA